MHSIQRYMLIGPVLLFVAITVVFLIKRQEGRPNTPYRQLVHARSIERRLQTDPEATRADWLACIAEYKRVFRKWPESDEVVEAYVRIGTIYRKRLKDRAQAKTWYARVIEQFPDSAAAEGVRREHLSLAMAFADTDAGRREAIAVYTDFIEHDPDSSELDEILFKRGRLHVQLKQPGEAVADFERILGEFPGSGRADDAVFYIGFVSDTLLHDEAAALEHYERLLKDYPRSNQRRVALKHKERIWEHRVEKMLDEYFAAHYGLKKTSMYFVPPRPLDRVETAQDQRRVKLVHDQTLDLTSASLDVTINPPELVVTGSLVIANPGQTAAEKLWLYLNEGMRLQQLTQAGTNLEVKRHNNLVKVNLAEPIAAGGETTLDFTVAKNRETPGLVVGDAYGHAFPDAFWFPLTRLDDAFASEMTLTIPPGLIAEPGDVAGGAVLWSSAHGGFFAYGPYTKQSVPWNERQVVFLREEGADEAAVEQFLVEAARAADYLLDTFGTCPSEKIVFAQSPHVRDTVFDHGAGLILINDQVPLDTIRPEHICNELVQQWYGCLVYPALDKWLCYTAGPASYYETRYLAQRYDEATMETHLAELRALYGEIFANIAERPLIFRPDEQSEAIFNGLIYTKGAYALRTIRSIAGDEPFVNAQRAFFPENAFRPVTLKDLRESLDEATGQQMQDVFSQWFINAGTPTLKVKQWTTEKVGEGYEVSFTLGQPGPKYVLAVELAFEAGDQRVLETARITKTTVKEDDQGNGQEKEVWNNTFTFTLPFDPERIVLDPDHRILLDPQSQRVWPRPPIQEPITEPADPAAKFAELSD